jgi:hypothetical protein
LVSGERRCDVVGHDKQWIEGKFEELRKEIVKVQIDIATLKVKASIWGLMGGAIPVAILLAVYLVEKL